jgi:CRP-like cAMP-binding protein
MAVDCSVSVAPSSKFSYAVGYCIHWDLEGYLMSEEFNRPQNQLLAALPAEDYQRLLPHIEPVPLSLRQILYAEGDLIDYVYFPHRAIVSLIRTVEEGSTVEVGIVGIEGMTGVEVCLGNATSTYEAMVQVKANAVRIPAKHLKAEFDRGGALQQLLLRYMQALLTQTSQGIVCHCYHTIEQRLARWLLTVSDRLDSDELPLTQEFLAQMIGSHRPGVTLAVGTLQQAGLIRAQRGRVTILEREKLEVVTCECYDYVKSAFDRLPKPISI